MRKEVNGTKSQTLARKPQLNLYNYTIDSIMVPVYNKKVCHTYFLVNNIVNVQNQTEQADGSGRPPTTGTATGVLSEEVLAREAQR